MILQMRSATLLGAYTPSERKQEPFVDDVDLTDAARSVNAHANNALIKQLNLFVARAPMHTHRFQNETS
jgi:hypothetical protein